MNFRVSFKFFKNVNIFEIRLVISVIRFLSFNLFNTCQIEIVELI